MLTPLSQVGLDDSIAEIGNMIYILDNAKEENTIDEKVYKEIKLRLRQHRQVLEAIRTDNLHN